MVETSAFPPAPDLGEGTTADDEARQLREELRFEADRIASMILDTACPDLDILLAAGQLRARARGTEEQGEELFERIYASRFQRLWSQFRSSQPPFRF
ncbi:MAG: hypothetical protein AB1486_15880 [Planctomycetota bacterium]